MSAPTDPATSQQASLLQHRSFVLYWCARTFTNGAYMMQAVAVGWQIYDLTGSAFDLGLVGLVQFIPYVPLAIVVGQICGPAIGGLIYAFGPSTVYLTCVAIFAAAGVLISLIRLQSPPAEKKPVTLETLFGGFAYLRRQPVLLGAMSLDLFAVLLGGVTALLPIFARDILETGPWGLGLLRSAPAIGALAISIVLAHRSMSRRIGPMLFAAMTAFGLSIVVFALSTSLVLSIAALAIYGAADAVSVVIRHSLVQTRTPNEMLGRVMAINSMFTGTSGTLGEFRAGAVAALFGAFGSVLIGGVGALVVAALWMRLFPELARIDTIEPKR